MRRRLRTDADQIRAKLDLIVLYLERLEQHYRAEGVVVRPFGWTMTLTEMLSRLRSEPNTKPDRLRTDLNLIVRSLRRFELYFRAEGFAFTPNGWDMTVTEMIARLKEAASATDKSLSVKVRSRANRRRRKRNSKR